MVWESASSLAQRALVNHMIEGHALGRDALWPFMRTALRVKHTSRMSTKRRNHVASKLSGKGDTKPFGPPSKRIEVIAWKPLESAPSRASEDVPAMSLAGRITAKETWSLTHQRMTAKEAASAALQRRAARAALRPGADGDRSPAGTQDDRDVPASSPGQPMPAALRQKMEGAFGADFSDVRVHLSSRRAAALGALAYTQGSDIHIAATSLAPETARTEELLGHEIAHVVQQRAGRVQATTQAAGVPMNDVPALELEADAAAARALRGELARVAGGGDRARAAPGQRYPAQRLMSTEEFKKKSSVFLKPRGESIHRVDEALSAYNMLEPNPEDVMKVKAAFDTLKGACAEYRRKHPGSRRKGIELLEQQIDDEARVLSPLTAAADAGPADKFFRILEAHDAQIELAAKDHPGPLIENFAADSWLAPVVDQLRVDPDELRRVVTGDIARLREVAESGSEVLKDVLTEVLNVVPNTKIMPAIGNPQTSFMEPGQQGYEGKGAPYYDVRYPLMSTPQGTPERLGALAHELTHAMVGAQFTNTDLLLSFNAELTSDQIEALSAERTKQLESLEKRLDRSGLNDMQRQLVVGKLRYPYEGAKGNILRYVTNIRNHLKGKNPRKLEEDRERLDLIERLGKKGSINNTLIEYDTVLNQILLYLRLWNVPENNEFHKAVRDAVTDAVTKRRAMASRASTSGASSSVAPGAASASS